MGRGGGRVRGGRGGRGEGGREGAGGGGGGSGGGRGRVEVLHIIQNYHKNLLNDESEKHAIFFAHGSGKTESLMRRRKS